MIATNKLRGMIVEQNKTQKEVAAALGMSERTFHNKMKKGVFGTDEVEKLISILRIQEPMAIFFAKDVV